MYVYHFMQPGRSAAAFKLLQENIILADVLFYINLSVANYITPTIPTLVEAGYLYLYLVFRSIF
jgi:hypothetical protein